MLEEQSGKSRRRGGGGGGGGCAWTEQMDAAVNYVELLICCLFFSSLRFCVELLPIRI